MKYTDAEDNQRLDRFYAELLMGRVVVPEGSKIERGSHCIFLSMEKPETEQYTPLQQALRDVIEMSSVALFYLTQYERERHFLTMEEVRNLPQYQRIELYNQSAQEQLLSQEGDNNE